MAPGVSAWASWEEWNTVYGQLVSPSAAERAFGVRRLGTWRTRAPLPTAVDLTGSFVEIMLNDPVLTPSTEAPRSEHELRLMYSMAMVRLVNGIVDVAQTKKFATSVAALAEELDWPQWFVQLRHDATHKSMPSLPMLRLAAKEAVWLLLNRFWQPQLQQVEQRGFEHGRHSDVQGRLRTRTAIPPRDKRLLDKRLRSLVQVAGMKRGRGSEDASPSSDLNIDPLADANSEAPPVKTPKLEIAARDVAFLAADETRLLTRVFKVVLTGKPTPDWRQAIVVRSLCANSSNNFVLRLARRVIMHALGFADSVPEPVSDNMPGLRNICDAVARGSAPTERSTWLELHALSGTSDDEVENAQNWMDSIFRDLKKDGEKGRHEGSARLAAAVSDLSPLLRTSIFKSLVAAGDHSSGKLLATRAACVWRTIGAAGLDSGAAHFVSLCLCHAPDAVTVTSTSTEAVAAAVAEEASAAAASHQRAEFQPGGSSPPGGQDLDELERILEDRTRTLLSRHEPWTAVGTTFDPDLLQVYCASEGAAASATAAEIEVAAELWRHWANAQSGGDEERRDLPPVVDVPQSGGAASCLGVLDSRASQSDSGVRREEAFEAEARSPARPPQRDHRATGAVAEDIERELRQRAAEVLSGLEPLTV